MARTASEPARSSPAAVEVAPTLAALPPPAPRVEVLTERYTGIHFSADSEFMELLEKTKAALSHVVPDGDVPEVLREAMKLALEAATRRRVGARTAADGSRTLATSNDSTSSSSPDEAEAKSDCARSTSSTDANDASVSPAGDLVSVLKLDCGVDPTDAVPAGIIAGPLTRYISVAVRSAVARRDEGRCVFEGPTGHRCGSTWQVEFAHVVAFAKGGLATAENIRLLCSSHNRHEARLEFPAQVPRRCD